MILWFYLQAKNHFTPYCVKCGLPSGQFEIENKHNFQVFPVDSRGIDFLGYRFFHTHTLLRKSIKQRFCRRVAELNKKTDIKFESFKQQICSWWGWCKYCDSINLVNKLLKNSAYESVSDDKPNVFQNLGNWFMVLQLRFQRSDQPQEVDQENVPVKKSWECESVKVWGYQHQKP